MPETSAAVQVAVQVEGPLARGMVTLRADLKAPWLAEALGGATACAPPSQRRIVFAGEHAAAWMSPDELLLFGPEGWAAEASRSLGAALRGHHHLAADVSDARALFRVSGPGAREVIAKGAPVDLAPGAFEPGDFRRTRLGQVAAAFWMPGPDVIELVCFRSVAGFVGAWLATASIPGSLPGYFRA